MGSPLERRARGNCPRCPPLNPALLLRMRLHPCIPASYTTGATGCVSINWSRTAEPETLCWTVFISATSGRGAGCAIT